MNWEYTHLAMAAGAGMLDQLRDEAASYRQSRDLSKKKRKRSRRAKGRRVGFAARLASKEV